MEQGNNVTCDHPLPEGYDPPRDILVAVDGRCPVLLLEQMAGIAEQCGKRHYFNAIVRTTQLITLLTQCAIDVVNGREPNPRLMGRSEP